MSTDRCSQVSVSQCTCPDVKVVVDCHQGAGNACADPTPGGWGQMAGGTRRLALEHCPDTVMLSLPDVGNVWV